MTTGRIAQKYGVPMPETCKELNWLGESTLFYWVKNNQNEFIVTPQQDVEYWVCDIEDVCIPAPQMHEIAFFLEDKLPTLRLCLESKSEHLYTIDEKTNEVDFCINVCRSNYAEAYAQLHLALKNEGIIS